MIQNNMDKLYSLVIATLDFVLYIDLRVSLIFKMVTLLSNLSYSIRKLCPSMYPSA